ncbi:[acyl-carrier-protein] S-malonyltransferase [Macrococcus hajekii]|uniref:Malonyl CoA-acyl carrier protein transacylase n=1 Tax=Macrococcus hajekii TaxID=198482 RepID=A0A4R6BN60_9STAP|nr:ACP S-malonyltransferase [Macrococcus hajekii]TDM03221.1 [acyl-carrier-protein] S-malonyltransferase [Macrococcus hajekii]GGA97067.1 malonyl CoA-acyl carrier protein transacylase [Macrococcus hajekii]
MTKRVLMFPGQGSQKLGMAADLTEDIRELTRDIDFDVTAVMAEDETRLNQTQYTQPAIVSHSAALLQSFDAEYDYTIGHSLGEYAALVASGVLKAEDAIKIVAKRGELMANAFPAGVGSMAAVLGLDYEEVEAICNEISTEDAVVEPANINCPGQIVVSGHKTKIDELVANGKSLGAKRVLPLNVSGPFHSSMMQVIADEFRSFIDQFEFKETAVPIVQNVAAVPETSVEVIKEQLIKQLYSPVHFEQSIRNLIDAGVTEFIEVGPGKVLGGLVRKISRDVTISSIETLEDMEGWKQS